MAVPQSRVGGPSLLRVPRSSTVDLIATELRKAIYAGTLPAGSPLREVEVARQLGVSRSPLREAAQRLVQEGLITASPGRGMRVAVVEADDLHDLYRARAAVEFESIRLLTLHRDEAALAALDTALDALETASAGDDAKAIGDADLSFHRRLVAATGNRRLAGFMETLAIQTRIATFCASEGEGYVVRRDVSPTYHALLDALHAGDPAAAIAALRTQFAQAIERLSGTIDEDTIEVETVDEHPPSLGPIDTERVLD